MFSRTKSHLQSFSNGIFDLTGDARDKPLQSKSRWFQILGSTHSLIYSWIVRSVSIVNNTMTNEGRFMDISANFMFLFALLL
jgi:hypothetical protein